MSTLREILGKPVLFHWVGWHGKNGPNTSLTGYDSRDLNVCRHQALAMRELGGEGAGAILLTYGFTSPFIHEACLNMAGVLTGMGMPFALCFDPWSVASAPNLAGINAAMIANLKDPDTQFMLNSDSYFPGKPVLEFAIGASKPVILAAVPGIEYWQENIDYDWSPFSNAPNKTPLPCVFLQFDDGTGPDRNKQVWNQALPVRLNPAQAGATFHNRNVSAGQYVQFITWNDVNEGTDVEKFASMISRKI